MSEFQEGDRVRIKKRSGWEGYEDGREAIVDYPFCEYGDHGLCVKFVDNGEVREFINEDMFEHVGDPNEARGLYEYTVVPESWIEKNWPMDHEEPWMELEDAENIWLERVEYQPELRIAKRFKASKMMLHKEGDW